MRKVLFLLINILAFHSAFAQVPTKAFTFDTNIYIVNGTSTQRSKILAAEKLIKEVIATEDFRNAVLNHTYGGVKKFVDNEGLSNLSIYNKILDGAETLNRISDNEMDLEIEIYYENSNTVGYTRTNTKRIWMNSKFLNNYTPAQVSRNMMHEWLHKLGFSHAVYYSTSRDYSVPYGVGSIMERLAKQATLSSSTISPATNLSISTTSSNLTLRWNAGSASSGVKEYKVYRKLSGSTTYYLQKTTTYLSFTQSLPSKSATYYVKTVAKDGKTVNSSTIEYSKYSSLTAATNLSISNTSSTLYLKWNAASSSAGIKEYKVYRRLDGSSTNYLQKTTSLLSFSQSLPSKSATYYVKAVANDGKTINSLSVRYEKVGLTAPSVTLSKSTTTVYLKWTAASSSAGIKEYKVFRKLEGSSTYYVQKTTSLLSFSQSRPTKNATYYIRAYDNNGNTAKSGYVYFYR